MMYLTGYAGRTRTLGELLAWSQWQGLDPEFARRILALVDASNTAGRPLGIGGTIRSIEGQERLFLSRHHEAGRFERACCTWRGTRYALNKGAAHAAPPGRSHHEPTTAAGKCLAIDFVGNLKFLAENCARYGLNEFSGVNNEPWHSQPREIPRGRSSYTAALHEPLKPWPLPDTAPSAPTKVDAPAPTIRLRARNDQAEVRELQAMCNFWRWRDAAGRNLVVDGLYGQRSAQAVMSMQRQLGSQVDGVYGPTSARALQGFLDAMAATV